MSSLLLWKRKYADCPKVGWIEKPVPCSVESLSRKCSGVTNQSSTMCLLNSGNATRSRYATIRSRYFGPIVFQSIGPWPEPVEGCRFGTGQSTYHASCPPGASDGSVALGQGRSTE